MSVIEDPFKEGFLWFPPHGVLGQLKKSWHRKYCQLFKCSKYGIDRLEVFDNEEEVSKTSSNLIITLENCIKITQDAQKHQAYVFAVITKGASYYFSANSEEEMISWMSAFQTVAFKDNISRQTIEQDNDLYCSSGDAGVFSVKLVESEASIRCKLTTGHYTLLVTPVALQLRDSDEQQTLFTWPYRYIRKYGYRAGKFTFEAGRKCESGEGVFHFEHSNQQEIFRCISSKMKSMKKLLSGESPTIVCGDNQFQAALSMVARSRSPLPPSPTSSTPILDKELTPITGVKPLMPLPISNNLDIPPPLKPKMVKNPPRRPVPHINDEFEMLKTSNTHTGYDDIEVRSEAWRTMGIDVSTRLESPFNISLSPQPPHLPPKSESQKIFLNQLNNGFSDNYDKLQHLVCVPKSSTSAYRHITPVTISNPPIAIEEPIFSCRRADDFQGYGMIRKKSISDLTDSNEFTPDNIHYALVTKANRV